MGIRPSQLNEEAWNYSLKDFKTFCSLKAQSTLAQAMQQYQNLSLIAEAIFGEGKKSVSEGDKPKTAAELEAVLMAGLG